MIQSLFTRSKDLVLKIDLFIDLVDEAALHFKEGVRLYTLQHLTEFEDRLEIIRQTEAKADTVRRDVESELYSHTLIPENRGDVLGILESMDGVVDWAKLSLLKFSIEKPDIPEILRHEFLELTDPVTKTVESLVFSARAYFYDISAVKDHLHKVKFYEGEADRKAERIKRQIFTMDLELARKMHLNGFTINIDTLADKAEEVANRLAIAAIKRII